MAKIRIQVKRYKSPTYHGDFDVFKRCVYSRGDSRHAIDPVERGEGLDVASKHALGPLQGDFDVGLLRERPVAQAVNSASAAGWSRHVGEDSQERRECGGGGLTS